MAALPTPRSRRAGRRRFVGIASGAGVALAGGYVTPQLHALDAPQSRAQISGAPEADSGKGKAKQKGK